jgi:Zn-dependent protease
MDWQSTLYSIPGVLLGLTVHEFFHAWTACRLGDTTAKDQGRLTLNPLKHLDPIGFLFILFAGFGWAKPVQFSPGALARPRRDKALIAAAGPVSNLILGIILTLGVKGLFRLEFNLGGLPFIEVILLTLYYAAVINFGLFVFNLIPIPPLDGSHIVFSGLNLNPETEHRIMRIGTPLLFIVLIVQNRTDLTILPIGIIVRALISLFM